MPLRAPTLALSAVLLACASFSSRAAEPAEPPPCQVGMYRLADGSHVDVAPSEGKSLRWRRTDGTSGALKTQDGGGWASTLGWTGRPDGHQVSFSACSEGKLTFDGKPGQRVPLVTTDTTFESDGVKLLGRLVLPPGDKPVPIVVLLHGSEEDGARGFDSMQRRLPGEGVGAFVYDKRGTGSSGGQYTQDFEQLARDGVAAMKEARRLAGPRAGRVGYLGPSQGGWVAPIAANKAPVDFVIVAFGLAVSVLDEDREAIVMNLEEKHFDKAAIADAMKLADAVGALMQNPVASQFQAFAEVRDRYRDAPWFAAARGNFTHFVKGLDMAGFEKFKFMAQRGTPWAYDPVPALQKLNTPQLWALGEDDIDAPYAETARRLAKLRAAGKPITTAVFHKTEHGIYEFETAADGKRNSTRQPATYLPMLVDFANGRPVKGTADAAVNAAVGKP